MQKECKAAQFKNYYIKLHVICFKHDRHSTYWFSETVLPMSTKDREDGLNDRILLSYAFFYVIYESDGTLRKPAFFAKVKMSSDRSSINTFGIVLVGPTGLE